MLGRLGCVGTPGLASVVEGVGDPVSSGEGRNDASVAFGASAVIGVIFGDGVDELGPASSVGGSDS